MAQEQLMNYPGDIIEISGTRFVITQMELSQDWSNAESIVSSFGHTNIGRRLILSLESVGPIDQFNVTMPSPGKEEIAKPRKVECDIRGIDFDFVDLKL